MTKKLIAFDLDGTLVLEESSWGKINDHFGNLQDSLRSMQQYLNNEIDYEEWVRRDVSGWPKPLHVSELRKVLSQWTLREGASEVINEVKRRKANVCIITSGLNIIADEVARHLGIEIVLANELVTDSNGFITGEGIVRVDPMKKDLALEKVCKDLSLSPKDAIAVGDSQFDVRFLKAAGIGLLIGNEELAKQVSARPIESLRDVLAYLDA